MATNPLDPFGVFDVQNTQYVQPPRLSATAQANQQAQLQAEALNNEAVSIVQGIRSNPDWANGSTRLRQDYINNWEANVWPTYSQQRFGDEANSVTANQYKNSILRSLRGDLNAQTSETSGIGNTVYNIGQSFARGADQAYDALRYGVPVAIDAVQDSRAASNIQSLTARRTAVAESFQFTPEQKAEELARIDNAIATIQANKASNQEELATSLDNFNAAIGRSELRETQRQINNPRRADIATREAELAANPDNIVLWERIKEGGVTGGVEALLGAVAEQIPNAAAVITTATAGALTGGPVGGVVGAAAGGAVITGAQLVSELTQEIYAAPMDLLRSLPQFAELRAQGLTDEQIRQEIASQAAAELLPIAVGIGAASGVLGPEALIARTSVLGPLLRGGVGRRVVTGVVSGGVEEFISEGAEQVAQNYAWNQATGDVRALSEGVAEAAVTGGLVGSVFGGVGGGVNTHTPAQGQDNTTVAGTTTTPAASTIGGFNIITPNTDNIVTPANAGSNVQGAVLATRLKEATSFLQTADARMQELIKSQRVPTAKDVATMFVDLRNAEVRGTTRENIDRMLANFQVNANIPLESNINVTSLYDEWVARVSTPTEVSQDQELTNIISEINRLERLNLNDPQQSYNSRLAELSRQRLRLERQQSPATASIAGFTWNDTARNFFRTQVARGVFASLSEAEQAYSQLSYANRTAINNGTYISLVDENTTTQLGSILANIILDAEEGRATPLAVRERVLRLQESNPNRNIQQLYDELSGNTETNEIINEWVSEGVYDNLDQAITSLLEDPQFVARLNNEQLRQTTAEGTGQTDQGTVDIVGQRTTDTAAESAGNVPGSVGDNAGTGGTISGAGISGTAEPNATTTAGLIQSDQPLGRQTGDRTDSGSNNQLVSPTVQESSASNGSSLSAEEYGQGDAGRAINVSGLAESGSLVSIQAQRQVIADQMYERLIAANSDPEFARNYANDYAAVTVMLQNSEPDAAYRIAEQNLQRGVDLYVEETVDATGANPDNIFLQAIDEAIQSDENMLTTLATWSSLLEEQELLLHRGILPADVDFNLDETRNGTMDNLSSLDMGRGQNPQPNTTPLTQEQTVERNLQLIDEINEIQGGVEADAVQTGDTVDNADGTSTVVESTPIEGLDEAARIIRERSMQRSEAFQLGQAKIAALRDKFRSITYGPTYQAGRWHKLGTQLRNLLPDSTAHLRSWLIRSLPTVDVNFDGAPVVQAQQTVANRMSGARNVLMQEALAPVNEFMENIASRMGVDPEVVQNDFGMFATLVHTLEVEPSYRIRLEEAIQNALAMPAGPEKELAVTNARKTLEKYDAWQASYGNPNSTAEQVRTYGGRRVGEAQAMIQDLISKYGEETLYTGRQYLGDAFDTVTNFLISNGQLDAETVNNWPQWSYYVALTTEKDTAKGAVNDLTYFMPRASYHRNGSLTPAQNAYSSLTGYLQRAAMNVGQSEFATLLNETYVTLEERGNTNGLKRFPMSQLYARIEGAVTNGKVDRGEYEAAQSTIDNMDMVARILETDDNGESRVVTYGFMFDGEHTNESASMRRPFENGKLNSVFARSASITRSYASLYTRLKMLFPPITAARDTIERVTYLPTKIYTATDGTRVSGTTIAARMAAYLANPSNFINTLAYKVRGRSFSVDFDNYYNEFTNSGAQYTYNNLLRRNVRWLDTEILKNNLNPNARRLGKKASDAIGGFISGWGDLFYAAPALAQYTVMRKAGIDVSDAVSGTIGLMNMQQNGTLSRQLSAFYPFTNSIAQTASNALAAIGLHVATFDGKTSGNRTILRNALKGQAAFVAALVGYKSIIPALAAALGDDEDTGISRLDMIPLSQLGTFLPVPVGNDGAFFKVPTGFGLSQVAATLAYGLDRIERGIMSPGDLIATTLLTFGKNIVPNSVPGFTFSRDPFAFIAQSVSPMLLQPVTQLVTNRSYSGARIVQENFNPAIRRSDSANLTTAEAWRNMAKDIFNVSQGWVDVSPEQVRTLVNGYMGGFLQLIPGWIESDALYKWDDYQSTRDALGPFWTAVGASSIYNTNMNVTQRAFYDAKDHYDTQIRAAGIGQLLSKGPRGQEEAHRRGLLATAGFQESEINDYINIWRTETALTKINSDFRKDLDAVYGADMDEAYVRDLFQQWSTDRYNRQLESVNGMNLYAYGNRRNFGVPDQAAADFIRSNPTGTPYVNGNINLYSRPVVQNPDGSVATVGSITIRTDDGMQTLVPTVHPDGYVMSDEEAIRYYYQTGQHLGKFLTADDANAAAEELENQQERLYAR